MWQSSRNVPLSLKRNNWGWQKRTLKAKQEAFWPERRNGLRSKLSSWCAAQQASGIPAISRLEGRHLQRPSQHDQPKKDVKMKRSLFLMLTAMVIMVMSVSFVQAQDSPAKGTIAAPPSSLV